MKKLNLFISCLIFVGSLTGQTKYSPEVGEQIQKVENSICGRVLIEGESQNILDRMKYYNVKGLSVAVVNNYKVVWAKGYGWADESEKRPVTAQTLFEPGSISKSLNAVGVLRLVQEGKLDLDTDINVYLKSWKFPYDTTSHGKKITLRQLLSHSAGLTVHGFPGYDRKAKIPALPQVLDGKKPANTPAVRSAFEPGLRFQYSGGGTTISQLLLQDVTQQAYDKFIYENVLKPIGMENSSYSQPPPEDKLKLCATGYYENGTPVNNKFHVYPEQAAAGLWMTPSDLCNYIIETQLAYEGKSAKVLNQEMTKLRLTPYLDPSAALGVFIEERFQNPAIQPFEKEGVKYFQHTAGNEGFSGAYYGSLDGKGNGIAVFLNNTRSPLLYEVINSVARVYNWKNFSPQPEKRTFVKVPEEIMKNYTGVYSAVPDRFTLILKRDDGYYQYGDGDYYKMFFTSETDYFVREVDNEKHFLKDSTGKVIGYYRSVNGQPLRQHVKILNPDTLTGSEFFFNDIGWVYLGDKNFKDAETYFKRCIVLHPKSLMTKINLAHTYLFSNRYEEAISIYKSHLKENINEETTWQQMLGVDFVWFKNNKFDKSLMDKVVAELKIKMPEGY